MTDYINPELLSLCAMVIALSAPLLLALREFIIAAPDNGNAVHLPSEEAKARRGWTRIHWRDNAPWAGRVLAFISRRALAAGHSRYSMPDGEHEDAVVSVAKEARALLMPEGAWLREGFVEDAHGNKLRFDYEPGAARFSLISALSRAVANFFGGQGRAPVDFHQRLYEAVYDAIGFGPMNLPGEDVDGRCCEYPVVHWAAHASCEKRHIIAMLDRMIENKTTPPLSEDDALRPSVLFNVIMQAGNILSFARNGFEAGRNMTRLAIARIRRWRH